MTEKDLPAEVWLKIFDFLSDRDIYNLSQSCLRMCAYLRDELFLAKRLERRLFGLRACDRF